MESAIGLDCAFFMPYTKGKSDVFKKCKMQNEKWVNVKTSLFSFNSEQVNVGTTVTPSFAFFILHFA